MGGFRSSHFWVVGWGQSYLKLCRSPEGIVLSLVAPLCLLVNVLLLLLKVTLIDSTQWLYTAKFLLFREPQSSWGWQGLLGPSGSTPAPQGHPEQGTQHHMQVAEISQETPQLLSSLCQCSITHTAHRSAQRSEVVRGNLLCSGFYPLSLVMAPYTTEIAWLHSEQCQLSQPLLTGEVPPVSSHWTFSIIPVSLLFWDTWNWTQVKKFRLSLTPLRSGGFSWSLHTWHW